MEGKKHELTCKNCGKTYYVEKYRKNVSKFCSKKCYTEYQLSDKNTFRKRKKNICLHCGKEYETINYINSKFCSKECYWNYRKENPDVIIQSNQGKYTIEKKCLNCDKIYKVHPYRKNSKFCSTTCFNEYRREIIKCPTCKKEFIRPKYENRIYCSEECASKGYDKRNSKFSKSIENFLKENNINYKKEELIKNDQRKVYVDFLINNIVIECYGDYWHCNPDTYSSEYYHTKIQDYAKDIWEKDKQRIDFIINNNYNVIILWEKDWNNKKIFYEQFKNKLKEYEILKS